MLRDASQRSRIVEASVLASRCDAPQHEGKGRRILAKRSQDHFGLGVVPAKAGPMITAGGYGSRLSLRSAGTTIAWPGRSTNLRLWETNAGCAPLFPGCYLQ